MRKQQCQYKPLQPPNFILSHKTLFFTQGQMADEGNILMALGVLQFLPLRFPRTIPGPGSVSDMVAQFLLQRKCVFLK